MNIVAIRLNFKSRTGNFCHLIVDPLPFFWINLIYTTVELRECKRLVTRYVHFLKTHGESNLANSSNDISPRTLKCQRVFCPLPFLKS